MIKIGEVFFCERVEYYPNGSPREFINQISSVHVQVYPYFFQCIVVVNLIHSESLDHIVGIRMSKRDSYDALFESKPIPVHADSPTEPGAEHGVISRLEVDIPEPGDYIFEILLDRTVKHKEQLSFT